MPLNKIGCLALIAGPILFIIFILLQHGGLLIDTAIYADAPASNTGFAPDPGTC